jgi:HSP20 family protein
MAKQIAKHTSEEATPQRPDDQDEAGQRRTELEARLEGLRRAFDESYGWDPWGFGLGAWPALMRMSTVWTPMVDVEETDDAYVFEAEIPGADAEDVDIEVVGKELVITGQVKKERTGTLRRSMRHTGNFEYRITLPDEVEAPKIQASLSNGVLTVRVPKSAVPERRKISVRAA